MSTVPGGSPTGPDRDRGALEAAYMDLRQRSAAADRAGDWRERCVLEPLTDVADYVKRVGDHGDSAHYRADKASELTAAAVRLLRETFLAYANWPDDAESAGGAVVQATRALDAALEAVNRALWCIGHAVSDVRADKPDAVLASDAAAIAAAARRFDSWVRTIADQAIPDPEEQL